MNIGLYCACRHQGNACCALICFRQHMCERDEFSSQIHMNARTGPLSCCPPCFWYIPCMGPFCGYMGAYAPPFCMPCPFKAGPICPASCKCDFGEIYWYKPCCPLLCLPYCCGGFTRSKSAYRCKFSKVSMKCLYWVNIPEH